MDQNVLLRPCGARPRYMVFIKNYSGHIKRKVDNENEAKVHYNMKSVQHLEIQFPQDKKHILASHKNGIPAAIFHTVLKERYETLILKRER